MRNLIARQWEKPAALLVSFGCLHHEYRAHEHTVTTESYILKRYRGQPPSLIIHLHPNSFRFDQQDGSFSYQSEMRFIIEHLQKRTVPHDILEELKKSDVRFYEGWLIVRVVDHKTVASNSVSTSQSSSDDQTPFSINNYNPYITPSPWAPYPTKAEVKSESWTSRPKTSPNTARHKAI